MMNSNLVFAIRTKSIIKSPQKLIETSKTLKLTRMNQVLFCKEDPTVIGKLRSLRNQVTYFIINPDEQKPIVDKLSKYYVKRFKKQFNWEKHLNFGVNSPYKQKVQDKTDLTAYLNTYFFRTKPKVKLS